jgi:hypothetical protein
MHNRFSDTLPHAHDDRNDAARDSEAGGKHQVEEPHAFTRGLLVAIACTAAAVGLAEALVRAL